MSENKVVYMDIDEVEEELDVLEVAEDCIKKLMAEVKMLREENKKLKSEGVKEAAARAWVKNNFSLNTDAAIDLVKGVKAILGGVNP